MGDTNRYNLQSCVERAKKELTELFQKEQDEIGEPHIHFIARKYTPLTASACLEVLEDNNWLLGMETGRGRLLIDSIQATAAESIAKALYVHFSELSQAEAVMKREKAARKAKLLGKA